MLISILAYITGVFLLSLGLFPLKMAGTKILFFFLWLAWASTPQKLICSPDIKGRLIYKVVYIIHGLQVSFQRVP
jgi:hypothetical protein